MVFLPENTPVDLATGSKYASKIEIVEGKEKRLMIEDKELILAFIKWAKSLNDESPATIALKEYEQEGRQRDQERNCMDVFRQEMLKLGFCEEVADDLGIGVITEWIQMGKLHWQDDATFEEAMQNLLKKSGANWQRAENAVSSKEYWEAYFKQHPEQRPKHLVFYDGNPTMAIREFQTKHNIGQADVSEVEGKLLGFNDRHVSDMDNDPRVNRGHTELVETAHKIIEEYYRTKK